MRNHTKLVEEPEENKPLGGPKCRWENNFKINFERYML